MKNSMKKIGLLFAIVIMVVLFSVLASALDATGQCGENVYWTFDETTGELVLNGTGDMYDYQGSYAPFWNNADIKNVTIEDGVTRIGNGAFSNCSNLTSITIPESVTNIGECAFYRCANLTALDLPYSLKSIEDDAFVACISLKTIIIPAGVTSIGNFAFEDCIGLETLTISDSVSYIGDGAFTWCLRLKDVELPNNAKTQIGITPFLWCFSLKNITIPENLTNIAAYNFSYIPNLESVTVKSLSANFEGKSLGLNGIFSGLSDEKLYGLAAACKEGSQEAYSELESYMLPEAEFFYKGTVYCHSGSTAEVYASEHNLDSVLTHFFEGEWLYDSENKISYRKCTLCDEIETDKSDEPDEPEIPNEPAPEVPDISADPSDDCSCKCHKGGIVGFFWKIANFFNKLFKIKSKQMCACGAAHF